MDGNRGVEMLAPDSASRQALRLLVDHQPERHDFVIGFVGPIGTAWKPVLRAFEDSLRRFDYDTKTVQVVGLLDELAYRPWGPLPDRDSRDYYERRMNAGDGFRAATRSGASMAALAVREIEKHRSGREPDSTPIVYLLKSLKNPDEVELLRQVYGEAFALVGVASSADEEGVPPVVESRRRQEHVTPPSASRQGRHPSLRRGAPSASRGARTR